MMPVADASKTAATRLLDDRETIARAVTTALYAERPDLLERHGERGREKCLQDMRYNIEHLIPAVDLDAPWMFGEYVRWLDGLLRARGVETIHVRRCLELLAEHATTSLAEEPATAIRRSIDAGLAALEQRA